jgi:predicted nucleotidyltransferase
MIGIVEDRRAGIAALCERYGVKRLDLFGSAAGEEFDPEASDLDFVVSFEKRDLRRFSTGTSGSKKTWRRSSDAKLT